MKMIHDTLVNGFSCSQMLEHDNGCEIATKGSDQYDYWNHNISSIKTNNRQNQNNSSCSSVYKSQRSHIVADSHISSYLIKQIQIQNAFRTQNYGIINLNSLIKSIFFLILCVAYYYIYNQLMKFILDFIINLDKNDCLYSQQANIYLMHSNYNEYDSPALTPTTPTVNLSSFSSDFTAFQTAWKTSYNIPVLVVEKIINIIDQYYKLAPQLKKKQNQLSILLKYNTKLLQTIQQFRVHQKKIITTSNTLMNLYKTSMKKYCQNRHLDLNFFQSIQIQSIFQKFSMKEWKFEPDQHKKKHINKKYKDELLKIFKKFYLFEDLHLQNRVQKLIKDMKKSRDQKSISSQNQKLRSSRICQQQTILNQINEYNQKVKSLNVNNMFDLLQQRKMVQNIVKQLQFEKNSSSQKQLTQDQLINQKLKANVGLMDQKDYEFVKEVGKLHASIQQFEQQTIKNYISNEKQYKLKFKKQQQKIRVKFQKYHNQLYEEYTQLKDQLKEAIEQKDNIYNQMQMYTAQMQFLNMKQSINKKPSSNMSIQQSFVGISRKKQKPNDYKSQIKKLKDTITQLNSQIWSQEQYEQLGLKKQKINSKIMSLKDINQKLSEIQNIAKKCMGSGQERSQSQKQKKLQNSSKSLNFIPKFVKKKSGQQDKDLNLQSNLDEVLKSPEQLSKQIGNSLEYIRNFSIKIMKNMQLQQKFNLSRSIDPQMLKVCMDQINMQNLSQISQPPNLQKQNVSQQSHQNSSKSFGLSSDKPKINIIAPSANNVNNNVADQKFMYSKEQIPISPIFHQSGNSIWNISQANLLPIQEQSKCDYSRNMDLSQHTLPQQGSDLRKKNDPFINPQRGNKAQDIKKSQSFSYKLPSQIKMQNQNMSHQKEQHPNISSSQDQSSLQKTHNLLIALNLNQQNHEIKEDKNENIVNQYNQQNDLLKKQITNLKVQVNKFQSLLKQSQKQYKKKIKEYEEMLTFKKDQNQTIKLLQNKIEELKSQKKIHQKEQNTKQNHERKQKIDQLQKLSQRYEFLKKELQENIQTRKLQIKQLQNNLLDKECQKQVAVEKLHRFQDQNRSLIEKINLFQSQNKRIEKKVNQITNQIKVISQNLKEKQNENELLRQEKERIQVKLNSLDKKILQINEEFRHIQKQNQQLKMKCSKLLQTQININQLRDNLEKLTKQKQLLDQKQIAVNNILQETSQLVLGLSLHSIKSRQILFFLKTLLNKYISLAFVNGISSKNLQQMIDAIDKQLIQSLEAPIQNEGNINSLKIAKKRTVQNSYDLKMNRPQNNQQSFSLKNDDSFHSRSYSPPQSIGQKKKDNDQTSQISEVPKNNKHKISKRVDDIQFLNVFNCTNSEQKIAHQECSKIDLKIKKKFSQIQNVQQSQDILMYSKPQQLQELITSMNQKKQKQIKVSQDNSEDEFVSNLLTEQQRPSVNRIVSVDQKLLREVQKQLQLLKDNPQAFDLYEIYKKYKQALQCLDFQCKRNKKHQLQYINYLNSLKRITLRAGQGQNIKLRLQEKLYFSERRIQQQREQLQQQRRQFQGQIKRIIKESEQISNHAIEIIRKSLMEKVMMNIFKIPKA